MAYANGMGVPDDYDQALRRRATACKHHAKARIKGKDIPFDLTTDYMISIIPEDGKCPVFGVTFDVKQVKEGRHGPKEYSVSCDRIDPDKGYVQGNVRLMSMKANQIMSNATLEELEMVVQYLKENQ